MLGRATCLAFCFFVFLVVHVMDTSGGGSGDFGDQIVLSDDAATDYEPTKEGVHALRVCGVVLRVCGVVLCDFVVCG